MKTNQIYKNNQDLSDNHVSLTINNIKFHNYLIFIVLFLFFGFFHNNKSFELKNFNIIINSYYFLKQQNISFPSIKSNSDFLPRSDGPYVIYDTWYTFVEEEQAKVKPAITDLENGRIPGAQHAPFQSTYREKGEFYYLKDAYCRLDGLILLSNGTFINLMKNPTKYQEQPDRNKNIQSNYAYEFVVFIPNYFYYNFAHWINEGVSGLVSMPSWVWDLNPIFVTKQKPSIAREHLDALGLEKIDFINPGSSYVYASNLFVCKAVECWHGWGLGAVPKMKKKFAEYFGLNDIIPNQYIFMNKEPGHRHVNNFQEIINRAREMTKLDWREEKIQDRKTQRDIAKLFASMKILVIPPGSITFNTVYMHDYCGLVGIHAHIIDFPQLKFTYCSNIWSICIPHSNINHFGGNGGNADVERVLRNINRMIYIVENQKYPPGDFLEVVKISDAKKIYFEYGDYFYDYDWRLSQMVKDYLNRNDKGKT